MLDWLMKVLQIRDYKIEGANEKTHKTCPECDGSGRDDLFFDCEHCDGYGIVERTGEDSVSSDT